MSDTNPVELLLSRLEGVKSTGTGYVARCPSHDDKVASLSVGTGSDGRALVKCFAGWKDPNNWRKSDPASFPKQYRKALEGSRNIEMAMRYSEAPTDALILDRFVDSKRGIPPGGPRSFLIGRQRGRRLKDVVAWINRQAKEGAHR